MSTTYNGNSALYPTSLTIPSDGDGPIKAADVNATLEGLADRTEFLKAQGLKPVVTTFTASGSLAIPADAKNFILWEGCGGGGGGAAGSNGDQAGACGGGGGAGAPLCHGMASVTPGTTLDITVGAGGTGGTFGPPTAGNFGGDSEIGAGGSIATMFGGAGGRPADGQSSPNSLIAYGGRGTSRDTPVADEVTVTGATVGFLTMTLQQGGYGVAQVFSSASIVNGKGGSSGKFEGGNPGGDGADDGTYTGGGPGGGGGAGPYGIGANGGTGGFAKDSGGGDAQSGFAGSSAADNSGAGGGGGGGGGDSDDNGPFTGGNGGTGGSGFVRIIYFVAGLP